MNKNLKALRDELAQAFRFASVDPTRPALTAVHLKRDGDGWLVVATDGHRLRVAELSDAATAAIGGVVSGVNLPPSVVPMMDGAKGATLDLGGNAAACGKESVRYVDETFPDYGRVIPDTRAAHQTPLVRAELLERFGKFRDAAKWTAEDKRIAQMKGKKLPTVGVSKADGSQMLIVTADGKTAAQWSGDVPDKISGCVDLSPADIANHDDVYGWKAEHLLGVRDVDLGETTCDRIGLERKYVLQTLEDTGDALLCWDDCHSPTVICGQTALHVIMPMRLAREDDWGKVQADAKEAAEKAESEEMLRIAHEREAAAMSAPDAIAAEIPAKAVANKFDVFETRYRNELSKYYAWADDPARMSRYMKSVLDTIAGPSSSWVCEGRALQNAWEFVGGAGKVSLKKLRDFHAQYANPPVAQAA